MKKKIFFAVFLLVLAVAAFAADFGLSVGGGALLGANFTKSETDVTEVMPTIMTMAFSYETKTFDVGAFIFVDATYAELAVAYLAQIGTVTGEASTVYSGNPSKTPVDEDYLSHVLIVDLLGKYPIALNEKFTVFPALGVGLKFPFAGNDFSDKGHDVTWGVVAKVGGGLDFSLTQSLFLRCEALFGYQFASDKEAKIETQGTTSTYNFKDAGYNLGPQVKIGVGYKIF
jgi:opacity protein-like surface antigen